MAHTDETRSQSRSLEVGGRPFDSSSHCIGDLQKVLSGLPVCGYAKDLSTQTSQALLISKVRSRCTHLQLSVPDDFVESKLLKSGTNYNLGRKDRPLRINHKQVSHDHLALTVGEFTEDDAVCLLFRPIANYLSCKVHNTRKTPKRSLL